MKYCGDFDPTIWFHRVSFVHNGCNVEQQKYPATQRQTYPCRQSRSIFRQRTDRGTGCPQFGPYWELSRIWAPNWFQILNRPQFDSQTVDPPKVQRYWHRQWQEHIGPRPITNGDHGEANEYEGDAHDEDNDEKDGVGVFFPHIFLHSFSLLAFLWTAFHVYVLVYFNLNVHVHILFPVLFRSIYSNLMSIFPISLFSSCQSPCLCLSCLMFNVQIIIDSYTQSINKAPFVEEM